MSIKAHYRREERYEGLQLVFGSNEQAKEQILSAIETVKKETKLSPMICENCDPTNREKTAIYIEFDEESDREGGAFFEKVLKILNVEKCC